MTLDELQNLDYHNIGSWPSIIKIAMVALLSCVLLGAGYYFDTQHQIMDLEQTRKKEQELKTSFEYKQGKAVNLDAYREQLAEMKISFGAMLRQLPNRTEVAELLVDVSQTGLASGLEFELFKPVSEVPKEFYAELPIKLRVIGKYHEFGAFASGLAALPRIVTMHDIKISKRGKKGGADELQMEATAKTYRYLDEDLEGNK